MKSARHPENGEPAREKPVRDTEIDELTTARPVLDTENGALAREKTGRLPPIHHFAPTRHL